MTGSDWGRATSGNDAATLVSSETAPDLERAYWATLCVFVQEDIISTRGPGRYYCTDKSTVVGEDIIVLILSRKILLSVQEPLQ